MGTLNGHKLGLGGFATAFSQKDTVALGVELDEIHETSHEKYPPAVGGFSMFRVRRVGQGVDVEAFSLIRDRDIHLVFRQVALDVDRFGEIHLVSVLDRVDQGLFQGEVDAENVVFSPSGVLEAVEDLVAQGPARSRFTRDRPIAAPKPLGVRHDKLESFLLNKMDQPSLKGGQRFRFGILDIEEPIELGDHEHFVDLGLDVTQFQGAVDGLHLFVQGDQLS